MSLCSSLVLPALLALAQAPDNPEAHAEGRQHYLGRTIARTMHWSGAGWLMRATREDEENGRLLRRWLDVRPGQTVCDLGCGNGYHTLPLAETVGSQGTVFAVDLQPQMLTMLRQRTERAQLDHVRFVEAAVDDPRLPPASCDLVLMVDVYHELSHPVRVLSRVRQALKPGGQVVLVEFRSEDPEVPIKPEHMMTKAQVVREMASHGFALARECDELPWQHAMAFEATPEPGARHAPRELARAFLRAAAGDDPRVVRPFLRSGLDVDELPALPGDARIELRAGPGDRLLAHLRAADGARLGHGRDEVVLRSDDAGRWRIDEVREPARFRRAHGARVPFAAMHPALGAGSHEERIALADELGFDGVAWHTDRLDFVRRECERRGGDLWSAYAVVDVATDQGGGNLHEVLDALAGGPGMLWLALRQTGLAPRDSNGDDAAIALLRPLLEHAHRTGVEVALYPHHGFWLETTGDARRLCERVDDPMLGVCFNLCHFLRTDEHAADQAADDVVAGLRQNRDHLLAVTVNGADRAGTDWASLIRPLGAGDLDLAPALDALDELGFRGPVGLQGYGIRRAPREHLGESMRAWRALHDGRR